MRITLLFSILITGIVCLAAFACNSMGGETKLEFYYYPAKNVYYDVSNARYIYSLNGGKIWDTLYKRMDIEPATLGKKEIIYSSAPSPWESNEMHRQLYGGSLVDIPDVDSSALKRNAVTERRSAVKPKPVASAPAEKTEKKPGFFKRLFGKKH